MTTIADKSASTAGEQHHLSGFTQTVTPMSIPGQQTPAQLISKSKSHHNSNVNITSDMPLQNNVVIKLNDIKKSSINDTTTAHDNRDQANKQSNLQFTSVGSAELTETVIIPQW